MKKTIIILAFIISNIAVAQDLKGLRVGINGGIPLRESADFFTFNVGAEIGFVHQMEGAAVGITTGFSMYTVKSAAEALSITSDRSENFNVIPIAAVLQFPLSEKIFIGTDIGAVYFLGKEATTGGAYIQPKVGYQRERFEIYLAYRKTSQTGGGTNIEGVNIGVNYKFK